MHVETRPTHFLDCIASDAGALRHTKCLAVYLNTWQGLADRLPELKGIARDLRRCVERNLIAKKRRGKPYSCKRPGCPYCASRKQEETANRISALFLTKHTDTPAIIGGRFVARPVPLAEVGSVVSNAITAWGRAARAKSFTHTVATWARIIEIRPADLSGHVEVRINVILRTLRGGSKHALEVMLSKVSGLLSAYGWRPVEVIHFEDRAPLNPVTSLSASGFDPHNFCCDGKHGLRPDPSNLLPLHKALHNRRLVTFGGETQAMAA